jgi:hypothetical protein
VLGPYQGFQYLGERVTGIWRAGPEEGSSSHSLAGTLKSSKGPNWSLSGSCCSPEKEGGICTQKRALLPPVPWSREPEIRPVLLSRRGFLSSSQN